MNNSRIKKYLYLGIILILPASVYFILSKGTHHYTPLPFAGPKQVIENEDGTTDTLYHTIPYFEFTNQDGKTITQEDLLGKVYVANFFFASCPTICKKLAINMKYLQDKLKRSNKNINLISITVNPEHDSPEVLKNYARRVHANTNNWHFLTGAKDKIYEVAKNGFFINAMEDIEAEGGFLHSEYFVLIDEKGRIRGYFDGTVHKEIKQDLLDAIDILLIEKTVAKKGEQPQKIEQKRAKG